MPCGLKRATLAHRDVTGDLDGKRGQDSIATQLRQQPGRLIVTAAGCKRQRPVKSQRTLNRRKATGRKQPFESLGIVLQGIIDSCVARRRPVSIQLTHARTNQLCIRLLLLPPYSCRHGLGASFIHAPGQFAESKQGQ